MKDELISYETAVLAKEKGFDLECDFNYCMCDYVFPGGIEAKKGKLYPFRLGIIRNACCATQSLLQRWLREMHCIDVGCTKENFNTTLYYSCTIFNSEYKYTNANYEQALEKGLIEALKLIK